MDNYTIDSIMTGIVSGIISNLIFVIIVFITNLIYKDSNNNYIRNRTNINYQCRIYMIRRSVSNQKNINDKLMKKEIIKILISAVFIFILTIPLWKKGKSIENGIKVQKETSKLNNFIDNSLELENNIIINKLETGIEGKKDE